MRDETAAQLKGIHLRFRDLELLGACSDKYEFQRRFGERVLATVTTAVANAEKFNWYWIGETSLNPENFEVMRARIDEAFGGDYCRCPECDPDRLKGRFMAQCFAEAFLAQDGMKGRRAQFRDQRVQR